MTALDLDAIRKRAQAVREWGYPWGAYNDVTKFAAQCSRDRDDLLAEIARLSRELAEARAALETGLDAFGAFMKEANWGASALSADTIRKANEAPGQMRRVLASRNPADGERR